MRVKLYRRERGWRAQLVGWARSGRRVEVWAGPLGLWWRP